MYGGSGASSRSVGGVDHGVDVLVGAVPRHQGELSRHYSNVVTGCMADSCLACTPCVKGNTMSSESQWWGAASDTGNVLQGTALGPLLGGGGAAAGFSIDYERVPQAIADLEAAAEFFKEQAKIALRLATIPAPGSDGVSMNAVQQIGRWASDSGVDNLEATLRAGAIQLENLAQKLREDLQTYLQVDELNIPRASPGLEML